MTTTAIRCGLPVQPGPPQPTDQTPVVDGQRLYGTTAKAVSALRVVVRLVRLGREAALAAQPGGADTEQAEVAE